MLGQSSPSFLLPAARWLLALAALGLSACVALPPESAAVYGDVGAGCWNCGYSTGYYGGSYYGGYPAYYGWAPGYPYYGGGYYSNNYYYYSPPRHGRHDHHWQGHGHGHWQGSDKPPVTHPQPQPPRRPMSPPAGGQVQPAPRPPRATIFPQRQPMIRSTPAPRWTGGGQQGFAPRR